MARTLPLLAVLVGVSAAPAISQYAGVASTVHNLSISGPGEIRSATETEICKFCHIPHNAVVPEPLWGHALSSAQYETPDVRTRSASRQQAPQPDGSSRLCLSCHDGTVALGDIASEPRPVPMVGGGRLAPGRPGFLGTDLSGSHPISFEIPESGSELTEPDSDMGLKALSTIRIDPDVRLDNDGKIQCTTCHDPHSDRFFVSGRVPHFWVKPTVDEVCLACHALR